MTRRIAYLVAAILIPGGFVALLGFALLKALARTSRGRKALESVRGFWKRPLPELETPLRQAA